MIRLPQSLSRMTLACWLALPAVSLSMVFAAPPEATPDAPPAAPDTTGVADAPRSENPLKEAVENFWHYGKIARYDLAAREGQLILERGTDLAEVLKTFEQVASERKDSLDGWLLRWQGVDQIADVTKKINAVLRQARIGRLSDPNYIEVQVKRLAENERAYRDAIELLRQSGDQAVPIMVRYLLDPEKAEHHSSVRRALRDMGRVGLNPLLAATRMKEYGTLTTIVTVLGDIGFDVAVPYLLEIQRDANAPTPVREAADRALRRLGADPSADPAAAYHALAERYYYGNAPIVADPGQPTTYVWSWNGSSLAGKRVPTPVFNEVLSMRAAEDALRLSKGDDTQSVSLWLAANNKREAEIPDGATDPTAPPFPAHYYNVTTGTRYLVPVLSRALRDNTPGVALRAIRSMQDVVGRDNLFGGDASETLVQAMRSPDRQVRFEAALALAAGLPNKPFGGEERVVPLLAEAVAQTGKPNVLILAGSEGEKARLTSELQAFATAGGVGTTAALNDANKLPAIDVVVITRDVTDDEILSLLETAGRTPRLESAAKVVLREARAGRWARAAVNDPALSVSTANDGAGLTAEFETALKRTGTLGLDEKLATDYALRAAQMLERLAVHQQSGGGVLDLAGAQTSLLASVNDTREPVAAAVAQALGYIGWQNAQESLLTRGAAEATPAPVKVAMFKGLSRNAKFYGNRLSADQVQTLRTAIANAQADDIRAAGAEALGALNLESTEAKRQILEISNPPAAPAAPPQPVEPVAPPAEPQAPPADMPMDQS